MIRKINEFAMLKCDKMMAFISYNFSITNLNVILVLTLILLADRINELFNSEFRIWPLFSIIYLSTIYLYIVDSTDKSDGNTQPSYVDFFRNYSAFILVRLFQYVTLPLIILSWIFEGRKIYDGVIIMISMVHLHVIASYVYTGPKKESKLELLNGSVQCQ